MVLAAGRFLIDGVDLYTTYKVIVESVEGLDIIPKAKKRDSHDWQDESGVDISPTTALVYEPMSISLRCKLVESSYTTGVKKLNGLISVLSAVNHRILNSTFRGQLFPVLYDEVSDLKPIGGLSRSEVVLSFTIKLTCPYPERRKGVATVTAGQTATVAHGTGKEFIVWWGDGTFSKGFTTLTHTYTNAGTYTVLAAGTGMATAVFTNTRIVMEAFV